MSPVIQKTLVLRSFVEGEVLRCTDQRTDPAGKGFNSGRMLAQNGDPAVVLSTAGGTNGTILKALVARDGIPAEWVETGGDVRYCYTILNRGSFSTTELVEEARPVDTETDTAVREVFQRLLETAGTVVITGSKPAGFSGDLYPSMVRDAKARGLTVVLDVRKDDLLKSLPHRPDVIKPNFVEFGTTFFDDFASTEQREAAGEMEKVTEKMLELYREFGTASIISRGSRSTIYEEAGEIRTLTPEKLTPLNTVGCGDAMTAGIASVFAAAAAGPEERTGLITRAVRQGQQWAAQNALQLPPGSLLPGR